MKGYILVDGKLAVSTDPQAIAKVMPLIRDQLNRIAGMLNAEGTDEQLEEQINSINSWLGIWNSNLVVLNRASKLRAIADANRIVSELKWPLDESPSTQSPS